MRPVISGIHRVTALASDRQRIAGVDLTRIAMQNQTNTLVKAVGIGTVTAATLFEASCRTQFIN
jgi:hypothetical protein